MSQFYGFDFIFDGVPSQAFDMKIVTFEDGGLFDGVGSSEVEILTQQVLRKSKPYYLGRTQSTVLQFPLTFARASEVSGMDRNLISKWLFGRGGYKKLQIIQDDLNGAYFNCFMKTPVPQYIGNMNYAFTCTVTCDSPFAYMPQTVISASATVSSDIPSDYSFYVESAEDDYIYPLVEFKLKDGGTKFAIRNETDNARLFVLGPTTTTPPLPLVANDHVIVDNNLQIIQAQYTVRPINYLFQCKWFRLLPGLNELSVWGTTSDPDTSKIESFSITYSDRVKIGG